MACQSFVTQHRGTKRTMVLLYLILSLLLNDEVHSSFEVTKTQNNLSWEIASHHCNTIRSNLTFAVPVVNYSSMTVLDKIDLQGEAWVGYFQAFEYFLFIVCVPLSEIKSTLSATFKIGGGYNGPGKCYSLCGLQGYIGLQGERCYCIERGSFSTPETHSINNSCNRPSHCGNGMLCGDQGKMKLSVYKKVSMSTNDISGDGSGCLIVTKKRHYELNVTSCSGSFPFLCESYIGQTLHLEESSKNDQWLYSLGDCTQTGKNPTTFIGNETNFVFPNSSGSWWTSVVRDLVIRNCSGYRTLEGTPYSEGFLTKSNKGVKLEFVRANKITQKMFVACMSDQPRTKQEAPTIEQADTTIMSAAPEAKSPPLIPDQPRTKQEAPTIEQADTTIMSAAPEAKSPPLIPVSTVILPVGLSALALITVVTLSCVCWRRREAKAANNEEKQKSTETVVPRNSETHQTYYEHVTELLNPLEENDQGNVSSEYSLTEYNAPFSAPTGNLYDAPNFNIGGGTYKVTFSANTLREVVPANSYDHVRIKKTDDGQYDHVELQDQRNSVIDIDTYDHCNVLASDNTYSNTCQEKSNLHQKLEENVYYTAKFQPIK